VSSGNKPTPEQAEAATTKLKRYSVRASAGSGKTSVLVNRYIWYVTKKGVSPDEILTITFTRKAASEMKARIVKQLRDMGFTEEAQIAETGPIQTIHSFCDRLLRENALFAALDLEFKIIDETESDSLRGEAIRRVLGSDLMDDAFVVDLVRRLAGQSVYQRPDTLDGKIQATVVKVLEQLRGSTWTIDSLRNIYSSRETFIDAWLTVMTAELPPQVRLWQSGGPPSHAITSMQAAMKARGIRKTPRWMGQTAEASVDEQAISDSIALVKLALATWETMDMLMDEYQHFDFTRMEQLAVSLISNSPDAKRRVRESYRAVLVDEAQDMNPIQYELLAALDVDHEMLVGDPQQSIYGFRLADKELFVARTTSGPCLKLSKNHRSDAGILAFVDSFFGRRWGDDYMPMSPPVEGGDLFENAMASDFTGVEFWESSSSSIERSAEWVRDLVNEGEEPREITILVRSSREANQMSDSLERLNLPHEIVGGRQRFYARLEIRDLANCLEAAVDPYNDLSMLNLLRTPTVDLSLDSIVLLANHKPVIEALAKFDPPIAEDREKLDRFLAWFMPLTEFADRVPAWEILSEIFGVSDWLVAVAKRPNGMQELANVRKLLALASERTDLYAAEFAAEIRLIQALGHYGGDAPLHDSGANVIQIQTIHSSKGLEYPVVVLPTLTAKPRGDSSDVAVDPRNGLVLLSTSLTRSTFAAWIAESRARDEDAERLRLLYVAMTRAKRRLCLTVPSQFSHASLGASIASTMGYPKHVPPGVIVRKEKPS